ncbi:MAG: DUF962 domain-containing protein [Proteobacteria bacterium]|nr:DUF962 domain-containing protein [Pseudomonadota bacterium]
MQTLEQQMSFYAAYHQDARNKATHFIGVPMIIFGLFIALGWARADIGGVTLTAAMLLAAELFFALGYKPALHAAVQKRALEMRAAAGVMERTAAA